MAKKQKKQQEEETAIVDPHEPQLKTSMAILPIIRWEFISIVLGCIGSGGIGAIPILLYLVLGRLIDSFTSSAGYTPSLIVSTAVGLRDQAFFRRNINNLSFWITIIAIGSGIAAFLSNFFLNLAHDRIGSNLKSAYFHALLNQEIGYFDMKRTGELISSLTESMESIQDAWSIKLGKLVESAVQAILGIVMALIAGWKMALVMLSVSPLLATLLGGVGVLTQVFTKRIGHYNGKAASIATEVIGSMRTIRSMDGEEKEKDRFDAKLSAANLLYFFKSLSLGSALAGALFSIWATIALAFWFGGGLVIKGEMTVGDMFQVFGYVIMSVLGISGALQISPDFSKAGSSMEAILKVIKRVPALRPQGGITPNRIDGNIEFQNVNFSYPTRLNVQVLKNFSLSIKPGQSVALVGASGSGKSTVCITCYVNYFF
jgi:ATP-binding cassette subfamily B (MDR/TAP) protein 1